MESGPPYKFARFSEAGWAGMVLGRGGRFGFTFMQLRELEEQILIFQDIAGCLPIPFHLVLPIWKSVAGSSPFFRDHYSSPSFMDLSSFHYGGVMESEPGRCRRTDGKKWRCSKPVVLNHKYCQRHLHRSRPRPHKQAVATVSSVSPPPKLGFSPVSVLSDDS